MSNLKTKDVTYARAGKVDNCHLQDCNSPSTPPAPSASFFASIDLVRIGGAWQVLEINSGVMMEALGKLHSELLQATYDAALERLFNASF